VAAQISRSALERDAGCCEFFSRRPHATAYTLFSLGTIANRCLRSERGATWTLGLSHKQYVPMCHSRLSCGSAHSVPPHISDPYWLIPATSMCLWAIVFVIKHKHFCIFEHSKWKYRKYISTIFHVSAFVLFLQNFFLLQTYKLFRAIFCNSLQAVNDVYILLYWLYFLIQGAGPTSTMQTVTVRPAAGHLAREELLKSDKREE